MKILSGAARARRRADGDRRPALRPGRTRATAAGGGVSMIYQELTLAPHLTVEENIMLGPRGPRGAAGCDRRAVTRQVREALELVRHPEISPDVARRTARASGPGRSSRSPGPCSAGPASWSWTSRRAA
ncbi:MAG: hypothetical protein MZV64_63425 [Ignavibacteriales bacterium]|nr:hypothetical protein [Ignavibacteriales bacterium]